MVSAEGLSGSPPLSAQQYGVTKPISLAGPTEADIQRSSELEKFLVNAELYESKEEAEKREEVLDQIRLIVKDWVKQFLTWCWIILISDSNPTKELELVHAQP